MYGQSTHAPDTTALKWQLMLWLICQAEQAEDLALLRAHLAETVGNKSLAMSWEYHVFMYAAVWK